MNEYLTAREGGEIERPASPIERLVNSGFSDPLGNLTEKAKSAIGLNQALDYWCDVELLGDMMVSTGQNEKNGEKTLKFYDNSVALSIVSQWKKAQDGSPAELPRRFTSRTIAALGSGAIAGAATASYVAPGNILATLVSGAVATTGATLADMCIRSGYKRQPERWLEDQERAVRELLSEAEIEIKNNTLLPEADLGRPAYVSLAPLIKHSRGTFKPRSSTVKEVYSQQQERAERFWQPVIQRYHEQAHDDTTWLVRDEGEWIQAPAPDMSIGGPVAALGHILGQGVEGRDVWEPLRDLLYARIQITEEMTDLRNKVNAAYKADNNRMADWGTVKLYIFAPKHFKDKAVKKWTEAGDSSRIIDEAFDNMPARGEIWQKYLEEEAKGLPAPHEILDQKYQQAWFDFVDAITQAGLLRQWGSVSELVATTSPSDVADRYIYWCKDELFRAMDGLERTQENIWRVEEALRIINDMPEMALASPPPELYRAFYGKYGERLGMATPDEFEEQYLQL